MNPGSSVATGVRPRWHIRRSTSIWTLALLFVGGAVRCGLGAFVRTGTGDQTMLLAGVGLGCLILALAVYLADERLAAAATPALLIGVLGVTTLLVALSRSRADVILNAFAYPWAGLYAAHFLSRPAAYAFAALTSISFAIGIAFTGLHGLQGAWVMLTATMGIMTVVTATLVAALRTRSETDPLTGAANRAGFSRLAALVLASAARRGEPAAVILCDVDGLKQVNDTRGHAAGDALLADVAAAWRPLLRGGDVLGRIGGDEFAILVSDTDAAGADAVVRRLREATAWPFSAGVAISTPEDGIEGLLARADAAMYVHKQAARRMARSFAYVGATGPGSSPVRSR